MNCAFCQAEIAQDSIVCPECGAPQPQEVEGFDNAVMIQLLLKAIVREHGSSILVQTSRYIALINDYLHDYDKERRLIVNMLHAGILRNMIDEQHDKQLAVMRAVSNMQTECFIVENAAEFVAVCFSYVLGWRYESTMRVKVSAPAAVLQPAAAPPVSAGEKPAGPLSPETQVFRPIDALKSRFARNVVVQEGFTKLESFCFDRFSSMRSIVLPSTLLAIGEYAFSECKHLKNADLPASLKQIQQGAFSQCVNLVVIKIPQGVLEVADNTFLCCQSLEIAEIPATVTSIGANAFSGCAKLNKLFLHDSVKYIADDAFLQCPNLTIGCYENSYVHKYCLSHNIKFETTVKDAVI